MENNKKLTVFVVDDEVSVQESLRMILKDKYQVFTFGSAEEALNEGFREPDLIFTDVKMLPMNGIEFLKRVKELNPGVEVIIVTAYPDFSSTVDALRLGAFDYIVKAFTKDEVLVAAEKALQKRKQVMERDRMVQKLRKAIAINYEATTRALVSTIDAKDSYTAEHSQRTSQLLVKIEERIGIPHSKLILYKRAAELHDIGKVGIEERILRKPASLNPVEFGKIKQHPVIGYQILCTTTFLQEGLDLVLYHHERYDGQGYPKGLRGEKIPFLARLFAIIDAYDAMTTERPYKRKLSPKEAIEEVIKERGKQFDPLIVDLLVPHLLNLEEEGYLQELQKE